MDTKRAEEFIRSKIKCEPEIGIILGSGLGTLAEQIQNPIEIKYEDIPDFPVVTVEGHEGKLIAGELCGKKVIAMKGRFHYYEGYSMKEVTFPIRVMKKIGISKILITNAAGGLREDLGPGSIMIITDHINILMPNPLIGPNHDDEGVRFPDMSEAYHKEGIALAQKIAKEENIEVSTGVYAPISGPSYSTKAELRMLIKLGADAVGMSTVPEVIVANHIGLKVLALSCITDNAHPDKMTPPNHEEIVRVANETRPKLIRLVNGIIKEF